MIWYAIIIMVFNSGMFNVYVKPVTSEAKCQKQIIMAQHAAKGMTSKRIVHTACIKS